MNIINGQNSKYVNYQVFEGMYFPGKEVKRESVLPGGVYTIERDQQGSLFVKSMSVASDQLIDLPDFISKQIIDEVNNFWQPEVRARYDRRGMVYKRGVLLFGGQGTGKSAIIIKLIEDAVKSNNIVFFCPAPGDLSEFVKIMREIEGDRKVLVVFEEFEKLLNRDEGTFLSLLDGELQIDNVVYIATTNYINQIPPRIKERPSRFATVIEVGLPNAETRRRYIQAKTFDDEQIDVELWVKLTEGLTIDYIKDLIISVLCIGVPLEQAVERIQRYHQDKEDDDKDPYDQDWGGPSEGSLYDLLKSYNKRR